MNIRAIVVAGWICFALDALFVLSLLLTRNMGDDAAGRGLATAWGTLLSAPVLLAGGLLLWGTRSGSRVGTIAGALLAGLPFIAFSANAVRGSVRRMGRAAWRAQEARFADPVLTQLARAIDRRDTAQVRALLAQGPRDFSQREPWGNTLLGYAVKRTSGSTETGTVYTSAEGIAIVRLLLENGVPYAPDATRDADDWFAAKATAPGDDSNALLEVALDAGADPNAREPQEDHPLIFSYNMTPAKLELLARRGADLQARSARHDRPGWSALMNAVYHRMWPEAMFFLRRGVSPDYRAEDGKTVHDVLAEVLTTDWMAVDTTDAQYRAFRDTLAVNRLR